MPNNKVAPAADAGDADRSASDSLAAALKQVDLDGDGVVEDWEVQKVVAEKDAATVDAMGARKTLVYVLMILAASVVFNAVMMVMVVDRAKDTETNGGYLTSRSGTALRTDTSKDVTVLTSTLPDSAFRRLDSFDVTGPKGSLHVRVTGFARYQDDDTQYNSSVVLFCSLGTIELDGPQLYYTESSNGAYTFSRIGLNLTSDAARRGRRNPHHLRARRSGEDGTEGCTGSSGHNEVKTDALGRPKTICGLDVPNHGYFVVLDQGDFPFPLVVHQMHMGGLQSVMGEGLWTPLPADPTTTTRTTTTTTTTTTNTNTTTTSTTDDDAFGPPTTTGSANAITAANATAANATATH